MVPKFDPYVVLGLNSKHCSEKDIQKAYKEQCRKWHPDKNIGNETEAQKKFLLAKDAFLFLFDKEKKEEYDNKAKAKAASEAARSARLAKADGERRKHIEKLQEREKAHEQAAETLTPAQEEAKRKAHEKKLRAEFEELRKHLEKEANHEVHAQQDRVRRMMEKGAAQEPDTATLRVRWTCPKESESDDYDDAAIRKLFQPYGRIQGVSSIITKNNGGRICIVEFGGTSGMWGAELEVGKESAPLKCDWRVPPRDILSPEEEKKTEDEKSEEVKPEEPPGPDYSSMSFEELREKMMGKLRDSMEDGGGPPEEKKSKWDEENESSGL